MEFQIGGLLPLKATEVSPRIAQASRGCRTQASLQLLRQNSMPLFSILGSFDGLPDLEKKYLLESISR